MNRTAIQWTDFTSNPIKYQHITGDTVWSCVKVSAGCQNCYAEALAKRFGRGGPFTVSQMVITKPVLDEAELKALLSVKRLPPGSKVFVGDMTDIFGEWVPDEMIDRLYATFALRPDVVFQVLTKRPERRRNFLTAAHEAVWRIVREATGSGAGIPWPLPNVWEGTSVEDQDAADVRIPALLATPAAVRYLSVEPLLGPVDIMVGFQWARGSLSDHYKPPIDWVIVGGESGAGARPMDIAWARSLRDQCAAAGVAFFMKQMGARPYRSGFALDPVGDSESYTEPLPLRDSHGGDMAEWPADLRVREFPVVNHGDTEGRS